MAERNKNGTFAPGYRGGPGRKKGSKGPSKKVKEAGWEFINDVFEKLFVRSEEELLAWIKENEKGLSRAEKVFIDNSNDLKTLESILNRVIGVPQKIEIDFDDPDLPNRIFAFPDPKSASE